jgi:hypothetical protein
LEEDHLVLEQTSRFDKGSQISELSLLAAYAKNAVENTLVSAPFQACSSAVFPLSQVIPEKPPPTGLLFGLCCCGCCPFVFSSSSSLNSILLSLSLSLLSLLASGLFDSPRLSTPNHLLIVSRLTSRIDFLPIHDRSLRTLLTF